MIEGDSEDFVDMWTSACEMSAGGKVPSNKIINLIFESLIEFDISHIKKALAEHGKKCKFPPTVSDVVEILHNHSIYFDASLVECPSPDEIIALAKMADTPLGVLAKIQIGSFDLDNQDSYHLRQRAQEVILKFDDYVKRCMKGDYSDHELSVMKKYRVDCNAPMARGLPKPAGSNAARLTSRQDKIDPKTGGPLRLVSSK